MFAWVGCEMTLWELNFLSGWKLLRWEVLFALPAHEMMLLAVLCSAGRAFKMMCWHRHCEEEPEPKLKFLFGSPWLTTAINATLVHTDGTTTLPPATNKLSPARKLLKLIARPCTVHAPCKHYHTFETRREASTFCNLQSVLKQTTSSCGLASSAICIFFFSGVRALLGCRMDMWYRRNMSIFLLPQHNADGRDSAGNYIWVKICCSLNSSCDCRCRCCCYISNFYFGHFTVVTFNLPRLSASNLCIHGMLLLSKWLLYECVWVRVYTFHLWYVC